MNAIDTNKKLEGFLNAYNCDYEYFVINEKFIVIILFKKPKWYKFKEKKSIMNCIKIIEESRVIHTLFYYGWKI